MAGYDNLAQQFVGAYDAALGKFAIDEVKHDPSNGQFSSSGGSGSAGSSAQKTKTSVSSLKTKLEGMSHHRLSEALKNKDVDPSVKKHIEKELDDRANRGTSRGHGEDPVEYRSRKNPTKSAADT